MANVLVTFRDPVYVHITPAGGGKPLYQPITAALGSWVVSAADGKLSVTSVLPQNEDTLTPCAAFTIATVVSANQQGLTAWQIDGL